MVFAAKCHTQQNTPSFKLIVGRRLVGVRSQQQTPINKFPENLLTLNRQTAQESSPILNPRDVIKNGHTAQE